MISDRAQLRRHAATVRAPGPHSPSPEAGWSDERAVATYPERGMRHSDELAERGRAEGIARLQGGHIFDEEDTTRTAFAGRLWPSRCTYFPGIGR